MIILDKDIIEKEILPYLPAQKRGFPSKVPVFQIVNSILYKLKAGCQWRMLSLDCFFDEEYSWQSVYYHFRKWAITEVWQEAWQNLLNKHKNLLDMSSAQLDGSHTPAKRGGQEVAYQGRKKAKTTNILIMTDSQGIPIACSDPLAGNHNDAFQLETQTNNMIKHLIKSNLMVGGLFLNADADFDTKAFRDLCFTEDIFANIPQNRRASKKDIDENILLIEELYEERFVVERTNAWIDAFKNLLVRFDTTKSSWMAWHCLSFIVILLRNLKV
jgi:transposase